MSKYGVFTGPYFPVFGLNKEFYSVNLSVFILNTGKYGPEKTPYMDIFHVMIYMDRENEFIKNDKKKSDQNASLKIKKSKKTKAKTVICGSKTDANSKQNGKRTKR